MFVDCDTTGGGLLVLHLRKEVVTCAVQLCKDMAWLHHAGTTLCQLLSPGGPHNPRILSAVETLLVCRFPLVSDTLKYAVLNFV